CMQTLHTPYSF
nr:immunoglobulin light chain junction region [Macaca mulatta]